MRPNRPGRTSRQDPPPPPTEEPAVPRTDESVGSTDLATVQDWVRTQRLEIADLLDGLDRDAWQAQSLCAGWTVHDVAAHLTLASRTTARLVLLAAVRARGDFDRMNADLARARARCFEPADLTAQLRESAASMRRAPGAGPTDLLVDVLVHGEDVARPLGRHRAVPVEAALHALRYARRSRMYRNDRRLAGIRLVATDTDWSDGDGPHELRGATIDLLLVATGRAAGLATLTGSGLDRVAARMTP